MPKNAFSVGLKMVRNGLRGRIEAVPQNVHMDFIRKLSPRMSR